VALTLLHMLFSSVVCFAATKIFKVLTDAHSKYTRFPIYFLSVE
jgi:hypothetical protein